MKIAIIHDWLVTDAGAEKVLKAIVELYPNADIFSLVDFLSENERKNILDFKVVNTSFIQKLPFAKKYFRNYLPLFPIAIRSLDLRSYDLIISSSWAVAKGVKKAPHQLHVSYCHTPIRYAWDLYDEYISELSGVKKLVVKLTLSYLRAFDIKTLDDVDYFIANSNFVANRIKKTYNRDSVVIYPPVDVDSFTCKESKEEFYLCASRLVPYKKIKLIVETFNEMPNRKLKVIGSGDEFNDIKNIAKSNIEMLGYQSKKEMIKQMQNARAFVYAAVEDFGIVPIEALSCGTPVIALNDGATAETIKHKINGVHFSEQKKQSIKGAVKEFESLSFESCEISSNAQKYSTQRFKREFLEYNSTNLNLDLL